MSALVQNGKYGTINTADPTTMGYYVAKFLSKPYKLQDDKKVDNQVMRAGELIVKAEYINIKKSNTNWYCQQLGTNQIVTIATHTSVHPCLDVSTIKYVEIYISLCNKK